jgi:hypothetical protein
MTTDPSPIIDFGVIGAGAAGVFCAVNAATLAHGNIVIFESTQSPLAKVRISGGGRCNVTHNCFEPAALTGNYPRGSRELRGAFAKFQPRDTVDWFSRHGVNLKVEEDGRMFPVTDSSQTVIRCLLDEADRLGVRVFKGQKITEILRRPDQMFELRSKTGESFVCRKIMLATGSSPDGHELARALGHTITALAPSLFTFKIADPRLTGFAGISFPAADLILSTREDKPVRHTFTGPLLFTHWGVSGPAVLKISAFAAHDLLRCTYQANLRINILRRKPEEVEAEIQAYAEAHPKQQIAANTPFAVVPQRWWSHLCQLTGIATETKFAEMRAAHRRQLATELTQADYAVTGKGVFKEEFVTAGGVALTEVDFRTMESKIVPGLFFAGEVLDVDGITGGFNFQNAWTTAMLAARAVSG